MLPPAGGEEASSGGGGGRRAGGFALMVLIAAIFLEIVAAQTSSWDSISPNSVVLGNDGQSFAVQGSGFVEGAGDYVCKFRTSVINQFTGDFETRTAAGSAESGSLLRCLIPSNVGWWGMKARSASVQIFKAGYMLQKEGSVAQVGIPPIHPLVHPWYRPTKTMCILGKATPRS
jgi:hypothetical protein